MNSLKRFKGLGHRKRGDGRGSRDRASPPPLARLDELAQAAQDMEDMRDCYDSLLSAAAATINSAYEFSESLQEMGACLLEKTALNDDEDSGRVLLMLGKVQFELRKLVDGYRSHLSQTITHPSESLLNQLQTVEEMKRQCDDKREVYEYMIKRQKEKGWSKIVKEDTFTKKQIQTAHEEYDEEATLFVFRMKSLKQGQSRSLLTQAARHHAAQLSFFKKAYKSLEAVEPHVKWVTEQQHIEYHFSGLDEDFSNSEDDDDYENDEEGDSHGDGELSFDYGQSDQEHNMVSPSRNSMELDQADITFPQVPTEEAAKGNVQRAYRNPVSNKIWKLSASAPIFAEKKPDLAERAREVSPPVNRRFHTYVLPLPTTPVDSKSSAPPRSSSQVFQKQPTSVSGRTNHLWHSSPLEPKKYAKDERLSRPTVLSAKSVLKESHNSSAFSQLHPPLSERLLFSRVDQRAVADLKTRERQSFSGPISSKVGSNRPFSREHPQLFSGPILRNPIYRSPSPPKVSPRASATLVASPKISELHELPRPPASSTSKSPRGLVGYSGPLISRAPDPASSTSKSPRGLVGYSAPLISRAPEHSATNKSANAASPLPRPPEALPRSFSIPSRGSGASAVKISQSPEAPCSSDMLEDVSSPPLTPIFLQHPAIN